MSRFFKSAAFPILIVVVLAFFAQKLIGSSSHQPHYTYGNLIQQLESHRVRSLSVHESDNIVNATTTDFSRPFAMHLPRNEVPSGKPLQLQVRHLQFRTGEKTLPARQLWGAVFGELN